MRSLTVFSILLMFIGISAVAQTVEQQKPLSERIEVNAVLIDAVVTDSRGNQILGLDKNDFLLTEDGKPQAIDSLDYFTSRKLLTAPEEKAPFKVEQVHEERYVVFFFDKPEGAALFDRLAQARSDVNKFIDRHMTEGDKVAIVGHDVRLKVYSDFTSDKAQLRRALDQVARFGIGLTKPSADNVSPSILRTINADAMMSKTGTVYEAITELADALKPIRARKNLILFSPGILEPGDTVRGGVVISRSRFYDPMIDALNAANVTVYAMNLQSDASAAAPAVHQTLDSMTHETNGDYYRYAVTFSSALNQVAKATAGYYLLTYRTQKTGRGFQKVAVSVKDHPEFKVAARAGYTYGD
ncbi:MAG TPA: VWA domain-containing protein [Thermoanaerobaculia bacterium]|nr:VWA domain-containing protein [Thermoanaerobaculia bacterium]